VRIRVIEASPYDTYRNRSTARHDDRWLSGQYDALMPIDLDTKTLDRFAHTPLYRQMADRLRAAITDRELQAGESLPSEDSMARAVGLSRTAVREAMDVLASEGLVVRRSGTKTKVAQAPPLRRMDTTRYQDEMRTLKTSSPHPNRSAFTVDHGIEWEEFSVEASYAKEKANQADADYLHIEVSAPLVRRRLVKYVSGTPVQIQRSAVPFEIANGNVLADPLRQPVPGGTLAEFHEIGIRITRAVEDAWARMPTTEERRILQMEMPTPVWDIARVFWDDTRPVEVSRVIAATSRNILHYETDLTRSS
jgi:GntR family transcriptional regulator